MKNLYRTAAMLTVSACVLGVSAPSVSAETLSEVLAYTYRTNPTLNTARANLRVTDEGVPRAKGGWRPTVSSTLSIGYSNFDTETSTSSSNGDTTPKDATLTVTQPLYRGGRTEADVNQAEFSVQRERANMFGTEQQTLLDALTVYMNVIRDQSVLELQQKNLERLETQLRATRDRFEVGEVTRTDVAQSEARVARADADLIQAEGNLISSRVAFERVVGYVPGDLSDPDIEIVLPESRESAVEQSVVNNYSLISAKFDERRLIEVIDLVYGELLPSVNLIGSADYTKDSGLNDDETTEFSVTAQVQIPIYQKGQVSARVRAAKEDANRSRIAVESIRRDTVDLAARAYEAWQTSVAAISALEAGVTAADIALQGVEQEATVGARTVLDVLDAEQELLDAQVSLVGANRNEVVAAYTLLLAMGNLTAGDLGLDVEFYDYDKHYRDVSDKWWGTEPAGKLP
ncbi:TolC family outer membrane protein [Nisaea acidiphila]|uniref:TolC family outer membrane protein n=1 Tax=Nisaea acidiphila TaxID=1862145 RepID=A0A9J7AS43_9PROT|nr:TolC family outer membrane protein [Nisaea acidiphila]UUX50079.1 TolC family outer membrane protein [Nisaea acidiphila]